MAEERKRVMGELAAWHIAAVAGMLGGTVNPAEVNPYRVWTAKELEARAAHEKRQFWAAMGVGVFGRNVFRDKPNGDGGG